MLYCALLPKDRLHPNALNKVKAWEWVDPENPGHRMVFDHKQPLAVALGRLRQKVERHALPLHLMSRQFTLTELQRTCEAILGTRLDKSAFRRRLKGSDALVEMPDEFVRGSQRPAQVYEARGTIKF
jgi:8-oxo-dGTP diphosphatase